MIKRLFVAAFGCLIFAACPSWAADAPKPVAPSTFFPLSKGTTWAYRGPAEWQVGTEVKKRVVFWTMEVTETIEAGGVLAARIKGHPDDMVWYEEGKAPSDRAILLGKNTYYETEFSLETGRRWADLVAALGAAGPELGRYLTDGSVLLPLPLTPDRSWGGEDNPPRDDSMYRWNVEEVAEKKLADIQGVDPAKPVKTYLVTYRCLGSHEFIEYAEGIGIIRYQFGHHGTVSECDMKLIEFRPGR